jgi:hypothetical protein
VDLFCRITSSVCARCPSREATATSTANRHRQRYRRHRRMVRRVLGVLLQFPKFVSAHFFTLPLL